MDNNGSAKNNGENPFIDMVATMVAFLYSFFSTQLVKDKIYKEVWI